MPDNSIHTDSFLVSDATVSTDIQALYCNHHDWLQVWLRRRLSNAVDASDLAHDTFVRVLVSGRVPNAEQSRAFLTQIAKGLVVDLYRRRAIEEAYLTALAQLCRRILHHRQKNVYWRCRYCCYSILRWAVFRLGCVRCSCCRGSMD